MMRPGCRHFDRIDRCAIAAALLMVVVTCPARAHTTIVPDQFPTIQAAVDQIEIGGFGEAETLLVRPGEYPEIVEVHWYVIIRGLVAASGSEPEVRVNGLRACYIGGSPQGLNSRSKQAAGGSFDPGQRFENLHVSGPVVICATNGPVRIGFKNCRFDADVTCNDPFSYPDITEIGLQNCEVVGPVTLRAQYLYADSNTFHAPLWMSADWIPSVLGNRFENVPGTAMTVLAHETSIARNVIRGGTVGIYAVADEGDAHLEDNHVGGCTGDGIVAYAEGGGTYAEGNVVSRCGGVGIRASSLRVARGNRVTDCTGNGFQLEMSDAGNLVQGNVAGRCGGHGIVLDHPWNVTGELSAQANTSFACGGTGIVLQEPPGYYEPRAARLTGNLSCFNVGAGFVFSGVGLSAQSCNDWFSNGGGATVGVDRSPMDLEVDPHLCGGVNGDGSLMSDSPLLNAPGCGLIGALGKGCEPPPVVIELELKQAVLPSGARGGWVTAWLEPGAPFAASDVDIAGVRLNGVPAAGDGRIGDRDGDGLSDLELRFDRVAVGQTLGRGAVATVTVTGTMRGRQFVGTDEVRIPPGQWFRRPSDLDPEASAPVLTIGAPMTIGAAGHVRVAFTLADAGPARLDVLDVAGRVVLSQDVMGAGPGEHTMELGDRGRLAQGIYFLRLRQGGVEARTRAAIIR